MNHLWPIPAYILGFITYRAWTIFRSELNRGAGGEIERIIKLKSY